MLEHNVTEKECSIILRQKFNIFLSIGILVVYSLSLPGLALAGEQGRNFEEPNNIKIITKDKTETAPLFTNKEDVIVADISILLENEQEVTIIESFDTVSLVEFNVENGNDTNTYEGYVDNQYLNFEDDSLEKALVNTESETMVPLFKHKEEVERVNIITLIEDSTDVFLLEKFDQFSLIEFNIEKDNKEVHFKGYVHNNFLDEADVETSLDMYIKADKGVNVPLYESNDMETSNILMHLHTNDKVTVLQTFEDVSFTTYFDQENDENQEGYIENQYLSEEPVEINEGKPDSNTDLNEENEKQKDQHLEEENDKTEQGKANSQSVSLFSANQSTYYGVALKTKTNVYEQQSTGSKVLKSYNAGSILKYRSLNNNWYEATVFINGKATTGYISQSDVDTAEDNQETLHGIALQSPTHVYTSASTSSKSLKSYAQGSILKYKTFTKDWYEAVVLVNGKAITGYIHKSHVENINGKQETLNGIGLKAPTHVYSKAATSSKTLKSYAQGSILKYKTFTNNWYEATVYINGKATTGYIHKSDVENVAAKQVSLLGIGLNSPTHVYSSASTSSKSLKSYSQGSILRYKTFTKDWYEATVYINGKATTGYIHKSHVENKVANQSSNFAVGLKNPTKVYSKASTSSKALKSYKSGSILKYKTFTTNWYEAVVYINGEPTTGYIHKNDVGKPKQTTLQGIGLANPTVVYKEPFTSAGSLKSYSEGSILKVRTYANDWHEATVIINGKAVTGYIKTKEIEEINAKNDSIQEYALKQPTNVYSKASKKSSVLKSYNKGHLLKFSTFSRNWYQAKVKVDDKYVTGYIHASDVGKRSITFKKKNYNISFSNYVTNQMKHAHKTSFPNMYVHKDALKQVNGKWVINGTSWNVRSAPNTSSAILGKLDVNKTRDPITVHGSSGSFYKISTWILANKADTEYYLNPANFAQGSNAYYQFLVLSEPVNFDPAEVNEKILAGKGILQGKATSFANAAKQHNVNELYLISHAILETGNGTSKLANGDYYNGIKVYNMYGIGAADTCNPGPYECGLKYAYEQGWTTPEKAIIGGAEFIGENYISQGQDTLYKMRWNPDNQSGGYSHQYATDIGWAVKQTNNLSSYSQMLSTYQMTFEEPNFK